MTTLAIVLFVAFVVMSLGQLLGALVYERRLRSYHCPDVADECLPKAAVVLCLRGADPFLEDCLERLSRQNYPEFVIRIIVDGPQDPARYRVERWLERHPELPVCMEFLREPFETCTLYCSSIHQALAGLDESVECVAFVNADTMTHTNWLRSLVTPLLDERVGAVTGNRWYLPEAGQIGSLVRYVQNASAVVAMYFLDLLWGGSLALKRAVFMHPEFLGQLRVSSCEDHAVHKVLKATGLRLVFSPAVLMVNPEECDLKTCFRFIRRQMVWTRIYHSGWNSVLAPAVVSAAVVGAAIGGFWTAIGLGLWSQAGWILAGSGIFLLANIALLTVLHRAVARRVLQDQGETLGRFRAGAYLRFLWALPLTLFVHLGATLSAAMVRRVDWRGVSYQLVPPRGIRLHQYRRYRQMDGTSPQTARLSL